MYIPSMLIEIELATESPLLKLLSITERWLTLLNMMKQLSYCRSSVKSSHHVSGGRSHLLLINLNYTYS